MSENNTECVCRICLQNCENVISLYEEVNDFQLKFSEMLENLCDIKIDSNDIYPKHICTDCVNELLITVKFIEKFKKTQKILSHFVPSDSDELVFNEYNRIDENDIDDDDMKYDFPINNNYDADKIVTIDYDYNEISSHESKLVNHNDSLKMYNKNIENLRNCDDDDDNIEENDTVDYIVYDYDNDEEIITEIQSNEEIITEIQSNEEIRRRQECVEQNHGQQSINTKNVEQNSILNTSFKLPLDNLIKPQKFNCNCDACGAGFKHLSNLRKHLETHGFNKIYECAICLWPFSDYNKLEEHSISIHPQILQNNSNDNKNEEKDTKKLLYENKQQITNDDDSQYQIVDNLENELQEFFVMKGGKKYHSCHECKKLFVSKSALTIHMRIHTGDRPFKCLQCLKSFTTHGGLVLHLRRHTGLRPFICDTCGKSFVESSNLKVHIRTHTGEKPHKCTICGKNFSRVFLLQIHQRTHTGEKPYNCPYCNKAFAQQGDLSTHKKIHTGERPHKCTICEKGFIKNSALNIHMKKHPKSLRDLCNNNNNNKLPLLLLKEEISEKNYDNDNNDHVLSINLNIDNANECDNDTNKVLLDEPHKLEINAHKYKSTTLVTISDKNDENKICLIEDLDSVVV